MIQRKQRAAKPSAVTPEPQASPVGADRPFEIRSADPEPPAEPSAPVSVKLSELVTERYVTARVTTINQRTVEAYAGRMKEGDKFPPVETFIDDTGALWLGDGVHRVEAARKNGATTIAARVNDGGQPAALVYAAKANSAHGLRRTNADKRRAAELVIKGFEMQGIKKSDREIGQACGVDHKTVAAAKRAMKKAGGEIPQSGESGATGAENTGKPTGGPKVRISPIVDSRFGAS